MRKLIGIFPHRLLVSHRRLFGLLGRLYPVTFVEWSMEKPTRCHGVIAWGLNASQLDQLALDGQPCLDIHDGGSSVPVRSQIVCFGNSSALPSVFRGQTMTATDIGEFASLPVVRAQDILCRFDGRPFWSRRRTGTEFVSSVAMPPHELKEKQTLYDVFNRLNWLQILPFLDFLEKTTADISWDSPPLRGCLMFDDPNLHASSYGHTDFIALAQHAREHRYHVSFATVPLDAWFTNAAVATHFRDNSAAFSLCIHGTNHSSNEYGVARSKEETLSLLALSRRRIERLEQASGLVVSKILVPPYGAFLCDVAQPMAQLGYDAVCVSRASLKAWNKSREWDPCFGHGAAEFINGLPTIPRHVMAEGHDETYRLAAFLGQPIIPHGHHQDCADKLELVERVASTVNSLGDIAWMDMQSISRTNFRTKRMNGRFDIQMLSRRIRVDVQKRDQELTVDRPWVAPDAHEDLIVRRNGYTVFSNSTGNSTRPIPLDKPGSYEILSPNPAIIDFREVPTRPMNLIMTARRILAETRDRVVPYMQLSTQRLKD